MHWLQFSIEIIAILYTWELCYREKFGWPLLLHHLCTLLLIQLVTASFFDTNSVVYLRYALLLGFYATTEQASFIALFLFRMELYPGKQGLAFFVATTQTLVLKTTVAVTSLIYYGIVVSRDEMEGSWGTFWKICFPPLLLALYGSQLYASRVLYLLGVRCQAELVAKPDISASRRVFTDSQTASIEVGDEITTELVHQLSRKGSERILCNFENESFTTRSREDEGEIATVPEIRRMAKRASQRNINNLSTKSVVKCGGESSVVEPGHQCRGASERILTNYENASAPPDEEEFC